MISKTFNEWSAAGYQIKKGSKGTLTPAGYKFSDQQVRVYHPPRKSWYQYDDKDDWDNPYAEQAYEATWGS